MGIGKSDYTVAKDFAAANLTQCCADLVQFHWSGDFPKIGRLHELVLLCHYAGDKAQTLAIYLLTCLAVSRVAERPASEQGGKTFGLED